MQPATRNPQPVQPMKENSLIVEDDLHLGFLLMDFLEGEGYRVKLCRDGESGLKQIKSNPYNVCILDLMLPKMDGFDLAKRIKLTTPETPFLFLTARSLKEDKLKGYALGAEDYISKPFDEEELLCKLKVILRKNNLTIKQTDCPTQFQLGQYFFDYEKQALVFQGREKRLTEKENEVLRLLCLHRNQILKREQAVEQIYGKKDYFLGRSFDVFISKIRKMLQQDPNIHIENVFRVGFILKVKE